MKIININIMFLLNIFFLYIEKYAKFLIAYVVDFIFLCTPKQIYEKVNKIKIMIIFKISKLM